MAMPSGPFSKSRPGVERGGHLKLFAECRGPAAHKRGRAKGAPKKWEASQKTWCSSKGTGSGGLYHIGA